MAPGSKRSRAAAAALLAARGVKAARRVDWAAVWATAQWLTHHTRRLYSNLSADERHEFMDLIKRSRGKPGNVTGRDRDRLRDLVVKAFTGSGTR